jgi:hypothetical protein
VPELLPGGRLAAVHLFNDPSGLAWFVVAAYFAGALAAFVASRSASRTEARFWLGVSLLLVLLGFNKELDLQSLLTEFGRTLTRAIGIYEQRRLLQGLFLLLLAGAAAFGILRLTRMLRQSSTPAKTAAAGITMLFTFILLRAASFHHVDDWVTIDVRGLRSGWWLELVGVVVIALSALAYRAESRRR